MRVAVSADHAAVLMRRKVIEHLQAGGHEVLDLGIDDPDAPDDYPDRAAECGHAVVGGRAQAGVLLCRSGAGAAIAANKVKGVRAAVCHDSFSARQSREDDDANVICLGERVIGAGLALGLIDRFLSSTFTGAERHQRRLRQGARPRGGLGSPTRRRLSMTNHLHEIEAQGQSIWLDNISRQLLDSGTLERLIKDDGISGVTSNPSIFEKAMGHGDRLRRGAARRGRGGARRARHLLPARDPGHPRRRRPPARDVGARPAGRTATSRSS